MLNICKNSTRTSHSGVRRVCTTVAAFVAVLVTAVGIAPSASAYQTAGGGYVGQVGWSRGQCYDKPVWGQLRVVASAPVVRSPNVHAGSGNDVYHVRYAAYLRSANTGAVLQSTGWSGWTRSNDNVSATWSGSTQFAAARRGNYVVDYRVEWWNNTSMIGWRAERVNSYNFYDGYQTGPYGPFSSCALPY